MDRTAFKGQTAAEAADRRQYYQNLTVAERLRIAHYLNSVAYDFPIDDPPRMDKTIFKARSRS